MKRKIVVGFQSLSKTTLYLFLLLLAGGFFWINSVIAESSRQISETFVKTVESLMTQQAENFAHQFRGLFPTSDTPASYLLQHPELQRLCNEKLELLRDKSIRYIYLLWEDPRGRFRFLCDGSDQKSRPLQKFDPDDAELWTRIYRSGQPKILDQSQFQGLWKSLLFPIRVDGQTRAMLVIDYSTRFVGYVRQITEPVQKKLHLVLYLSGGLILLILLQLLLLLLVRNRSVRDPLTGIYNRGALRLLRRTLPLDQYNVLMIDLDHFKRINDTFGHDVGDLALRHAARLLSKTLGPRDHLIRYGGEEFIMLQHRKKPDPRYGRQRAEEILERFRQTSLNHAHHPPIPLRCSIGLFNQTTGTLDFDTILKKVDQALYQAKKSGRNCWMEVPDKSLTHEEGSPVNFESVQRWIDEGHLFCEYQPIYDRSGRKIIKYETLVRLRDAEGRILYPNRFLSMVWHTNTYIRLTRQVLEQAVDAFRDRDLPFTVNLTLQDLLDGKILQILRELAINDPYTVARLGIEILEHHDFDNIPLLEQSLRELKELGISIILDDFGAGHTNLLLLQSLPLDEFKIDRKLVLDLKNNPRAGILIHALTHYARQTGIKVTAEYVCDAEIFQRLQSLEVDYYQGFHLGRPGPLPPLNTPR